MKFVVEFEGFQVQNRYIFKEIVVKCVETLETQHFFLKSPFPLTRLTKRECNIVSYCEKNLHHIYWNSGREYLRDIVKRLAFLNSTGNTVFTKGEQKVEALKKQLHLKCPVLDVTELIEKQAIDYPSSLVAYSQRKGLESNVLCPLRFHRSSRHCAYIKADFFSYLIKQSENE